MTGAEPTPAAALPAPPTPAVTRWRLMERALRRCEWTAMAVLHQAPMVAELEAYRDTLRAYLRQVPTEGFARELLEQVALCVAAGHQSLYWRQASQLQLRLDRLLMLLTQQWPALVQEPLP